MSMLWAHVDFIQDNFNVKDDFEVGGERYIVFSK